MWTVIWTVNDSIKTDVLSFDSEEKANGYAVIIKVCLNYTEKMDIYKEGFSPTNKLINKLSIFNLK